MSIKYYPKSKETTTISKAPSTFIKLNIHSNRIKIIESQQKIGVNYYLSCRRYDCDFDFLHGLELDQ